MKSRFGREAFGFIAPLLLTLTACRSTPPPPPAPPAVALAAATAQQAGKLLAGGNWAAAARQWDLAATRFQLVNDLAGTATARHNAGIAWLSAGDAATAHERLGEAAVLNEELGRRDDWWRNQVALLNLELDRADHCGAANRLARLGPLAGEIAEPRVRMLFEHARARALLVEGRPEEAEERLSAARALAPAEGADRASLAATEARAAGVRQDWPAAETRWREALAGYERAGDAPGVATALAGLGRVLLNRPGREADGERLLERAAENFKALKLPAEEAAVRRTLAGASAAGR
ncbi:MAG: hypothetical protein ACKVYV_07250 [Limisphaerales bacterium]